MLACLAGVGVRATAVVGYLPQRLDILDESPSVVENVCLAGSGSARCSLVASHDVALPAFGGDHPMASPGPYGGTARYRPAMTLIRVGRGAMGRLNCVGALRFAAARCHWGMG